MLKPWLFALICILAMSPWPSIATARAASDTWRGQTETLLQEGSALSQQRKALEASQQILLKQKQVLEITGRQLTQQQVQLNQQVEAHNQQVAAQGKNLHKNQSECNNMGAATGANTAEHVNECDNEIKVLNKKSSEVNQGILSLGAQQAAVEVRVIDNNQKINNWYRQEQDTVNQLNRVYQNTDDWMDHAYGFMASSRFQNATRSAHVEKYCSAAHQPSGTITSQQLEIASDYALNCLRRVQEGIRE